MEKTSPELAQDFHPTKNWGADPSEILAGAHKKWWWLCASCDNEWEAERRGGQGCPSCAPSGFDGSKPGYLYCLSYKNALDEWFKVGITNNEVKYRVRQLLLSIQKTMLYFDSEIIVLEERFFERGRDAELLERRILQEMKKRNLNFTPQESFQGISELFIINPFDFAREQDWL